RPALPRAAARVIPTMPPPTIATSAMSSVMGAQNNPMHQKISLILQCVRVDDPGPFRRHHGAGGTPSGRPQRALAPGAEHGPVDGRRALFSPSAKWLYIDSSTVRVVSVLSRTAA